MKIQFETNVEKKEITFFIREGELTKFAKQLVAKYPDAGNKELCKTGSEALYFLITRTFPDFEEITGLDLKDFTPNFVMYEKEEDLPLPIRKIIEI